MSYINIRRFGGGKWYDSSCISPEAMVVENRYEMYHKGDRPKFWSNFIYARDHGLRQIITIDNYIDKARHYYPTEAEIAEECRAIKQSLKDNRIPREMACFQLDNEPEKHKVPVSTYCRYANVLHGVLNGEYDLYVGGDEVSYRGFYNYVVAHSKCEA